MAAGESHERVVLQNGAVVLAYPVSGVNQVAIEAFYRVGFLDEPQGITQVAHLVEHLVCRSASGRHQPGELFTLLSQKGMTNAETLADFTHYDYVLPAADMALALEAEAERLTDLRIAATDIANEAPKCHGEAATVERRPSAGMLKHAFMAFNQAWRYDQRQVQIAAGLDKLPLARVQAFHRDFYAPSQLILVMVGGFQQDQAVALAREHLASIQAVKVPPRAPIAWSRIPREMMVRWDSSHRAVCIGCFAPPDSHAERIALSLWGNLFMQKLVADAELQKTAWMVFTSNQTWPVGVLPFFVYATARPATEVETLRDLLIQRIDEITASGPAAGELMQLGLMASVLGQRSVCSTESVRAQTRIVCAQMKVDEEKASRIVMSNIAIQAGFRELLLGESGDSEVKPLDFSRMQGGMAGVLRRNLTAERRFVTILMPAQGPESRPPVSPAAGP